MELLKFELYKIFKQKMVYIVFLLLIVFSTGFTYYHGAHEEKELYKPWEGTLTDEKLELAAKENDALNKKIENMDEFQMLSDQEWTLNGIYETIAWGKQVETNAEEKIKKFEKQGNYNSELGVAMFKNVDMSFFAYNSAPKKIIDYASIFSLMITGGMLLVGLSSIYTQEYSSGVDNYIFSSRKGRGALLWSKIGAALMYTVVVVIGWEIFNLAWNLIQYGNGGWESSIQYYFKYYFSPYSFTMLEFHLLQLGFHLLGACSFAVMIVLISSLCKNALVSLIINGIIFAAPYFLVELAALPAWVEDIFQFSFLYYMNVEAFFDDFKTINLFGLPVLYSIVAVIVMIVGIIAVPLLTTRIVKNKEVTS
ncbi:ABC transporter permease [Bacillus timonensis]|uniref:ABC transporter permease n=1 Tax=Bacillus timonensis TaxID=1033734 RepID=UPI0002889A0D|nr:ABC transporter permease [Bacillus timonensis]